MDNERTSGEGLDNTAADNEIINAGQTGGDSTIGEQDNDIYIIEEDDVPGGKMGFIARFISIFAAPGKLAENIREFPVIGAPILYVLVLSLVSAVITLQATPIITNAQSVAIAERYGVDFLNVTQSTTQVLEQAPLQMLLIAWASVIPTMVLGALIGAVFLLLLSKIMRGDATYKHYFSLQLHVVSIGMVGGMVSAALMIATGSAATFTSLAPVLMPRGNFLMPVYNVLSSIELFSIWSTVVLAVSMKKLNTEFTTGKAIAAGIISFIASVAFTAAVTSISAIAYDMSFRAIQSIH